MIERAASAEGEAGERREDARLALVRLAELLAKSGNTEGSEHALRRAAILHWRSAGSDLDMVAC